MTDTGPAVIVERYGHVMTATLNRPEVMNAVNAELSRQLGDALEEADTDPEIRAFILTGAGPRAFCAGADLKAVSRGESVDVTGRRAWGFAGYVNHVITKPTIAAVNGFALGGGSELALASDLVVAADTAQFGLPEVRRGLIASGGGVIRLPTQVPKKVAMQMILTGEPIDAPTALRWGLVNEVCTLDALFETALDLANRIARNAPLAVQASKRIAAGVSSPGRIRAEEDSWAQNAAEVREVMASLDAREGPRAFAEKREPTWRSR